MTLSQLQSTQMEHVQEFLHQQDEHQLKNNKTIGTTSSTESDEHRSGETI
jgi:hypothetical protein